MKKRRKGFFFYAVIAAVLCLILCACGKMGGTVTDRVAKLLTEYVKADGVLPAGQLYFAGAEQYDAGWLAPELYGYLYYGEYSENPIASLIEDYAVYLSHRTVLFEVHWLQAKNSADVPVLREMLENRVRLLQKGEPDGYGYGAYRAVQDAVVLSKGRCAVLIMAEDAAVLSELAKALL